MASSSVEFINRRSTSTTSNSSNKNVNHRNSKPQNNVDLSWLPDYCQNSFSNNSDNSNHQNEFDDSWLPNYNDSKKNTSKSITKSTNPNPSRRKSNDLGFGSKNRGQNGFHGSTNVSKSNSRKTEHVSDFDDSWLPENIKKNSTQISKSNHSNSKEAGSDDSWLRSNPIAKNQNKNRVQNHSHNLRLPNNNPTKNHDLKKSSNSNSSIQMDSSDSWLPNHNQLRNHNRHGTDHEKVLKKKPESSRSHSQNSPCISECSVETDSLGGVSTLLRKWKGIAETTNSKHSSATKTESKTEYKTESKTEAIVSTESNNNTHTKVFDSLETCASPKTTTTDGSESCRSIPSTPLSSCDSKALNHVEKEKIRVVDIVKKLSNEEELAAINNTLDCVTENKCFSPVICKTRLIRGRQAFKDFLQLMEQDKRRELESLIQRKPVSKFPNRGRIQAVLRVRLIRLGNEPQKESKSYKRSVSKTMKTIWDKFSTGVKHGSSASRKVNSNEETTIREAKVAATTSQELESTTTTNQLEHNIDTSSHLIQHKEDKDSKSEETNGEDYNEKNKISENMFSSGIEEKRLDDSIQGGFENYGHWISEYPQSQSDWDEYEEEDDDEFYYNYNWIRDVARPRSDWEYMRQKRYQEMLHVYSYNPDIQQLLQSKSVSGFLSSDLRNKIDKLMISRAQIYNNVGYQETKYKEKEEYGGRQECSEYKEFIDQTTCYSTSTQSPTLEERSWSHSHDIYDPDQSRSQSQSQSQSLSPYPSLVVNPNSQLQNNNRQSFSFNQPSIEMELIYDLKGQLEQLQQEIMELRNRVDMQQSVEKKTSERISAKHNCCICYEIQADSFLYRCGHMCTCYECGLKLQFSSKKCPICEALIVDVVRAHGYDH